MAALEPAAPVLLVADEREAADAFAREMLPRVPATFNRRRTSLAQLALQLATRSLARAGSAPASPLAQAALLARAVYASSARGELPTVAPITGFPGFAQAIGTTLRDLRLNTDDTQPWPAGEDLGELAGLTAAYADALRSSAAADRADIVGAAEAAVRTGAHPWLGRTTVVLLDLALESAADRRLIDAVCAASRAAVATTPAADPARRHLEVLGFVGAPLEEPSPLAAVGRALFTAGDARTSAGVPVELFSAPGEGRECVEIVRFILAEAERGVPLDEVAIFVRNPRVYAAHLDAALRRARLPRYAARGAARPDPAGRALLALLRVAEEDLSARRFAEYVSLGQVPPARDASADPHEAWAPPDDAEVAFAADDASPDAPEDDRPAALARTPWRWEAILVNAAVVGGLARWTRRLAGIAEERARLRAAIAATDPGAPALAALDRQLEAIADLRAFALPLLEVLEGFRARVQPWGAWLRDLRVLAVRALRWPERVLGILTELEPMADVGPVDVVGVRAVLEPRLALLERRPPPRRYGRVFVGTTAQARGRAFRVVFLPGLVERLFPRATTEDPFLPDAARRRLGTALPTAEVRLDAERALLRVAVGAATERLYVSYPRLDVLQGRARVPSLYALEVLRALLGAVPPVDALERDADQVAQARLAWPSPVAPSAAIDPLEYDLAVLRRLLRTADLASVKGRGRYLLEGNAWLAGALRARHARWSKRWTPEDGFLPPADGLNPVADLLAGVRLSGRPYSVSALQTYARCPYRFFLAAVQQLAAREAVTRLARLDPRTRGRILHRLFAATLRELRARGLLPVTTATLPAARAATDAVFVAVVADEEDALAPAIARVWRDEVAALRGDLDGWLRFQASEPGVWRPMHAELGFGLEAAPERDPASRRAPVAVGPARWLLRGAIDCIEERADDGALRVTDYKTGAASAPPGVRVGGGETLQPLVYSFVAEAVLGRPVHEGRLLYATAQAGYTARSVPLDAQSRAEGFAVLQQVDDALGAGRLPTVPKVDACTWCDFRIVCGPYEETRLRGKEPSPQQQQLEQLRRMP